MEVDDPVTSVPMIGSKKASVLSKLGIEKVWDLVTHIPNRYLDFRKNLPIGELSPGSTVTISGNLDAIKNTYTRSGKRMQIAKVTDNTGGIEVVWFNQPYLANTLKNVAKISLAGEVNWFGNKLAMISPEYEVEDSKGLHTGALIPVYPLTNGVSSKWLRSRIHYVLESIIDNLKDFLPKDILTGYKIVDLKKAVTYIHTPKNPTEAEMGRKRLAFDELLGYQLSNILRKKEWKTKYLANKLKIDKVTFSDFISNLDFTLTPAQIRSIDEILIDIDKSTPMNRLLEGDVGSGKTIVSAVGCFAAFVNGHQSIIMAPTQILAKQHYETFKKLFDKYNARVSLITGKLSEKALGRTDIFIGTHALFSQKELFEKVAFVVIDEQHRFGVKQRDLLIKKSRLKKLAPHVLTMTATPIPRSIALTAYGDLDLSVLDEMPKGRITPKTWLVPENKRDDAYNWIKTTLAKERTQMYVICPLIEESQSESLSQVKSAKLEYEKLKKEFPKFKIALLHGELKEKEKITILTDFKVGKYDILVATPIVEVGIDVANANIMIVEGADRFGLAQLHQLRGRIGRGDKSSYCILFSETSSKKTTERLSALKRESSGFALSEIDLKLRGPGEVFGIRQHGFPELRIARWQDFELIKSSKKLALEIFSDQKKYINAIRHYTKVDIAPN